MVHTIDAGAAKLAGLQMDLLGKLRSGQITLDHLEWYLRCTRDERDALMAGVTPVARSVPKTAVSPIPKFVLLADLGVIVVPEGYDHTTALAAFDKEHRQALYGYNGDITDAHFPNPSRILRPGDRLGVQAFRQTMPSTSSEERMAFLATEEAVFTGAQGAVLVWKQKRNQLPKGYWFVSMDRKDRLCEGPDGRHRMPRLYAHSGDGFSFDMASFERSWYDDNVLLRFHDLS